MAYFSQLLTQKAHTLRLPKNSTEHVQRLVRMHQSASVERAPFHRQLDFWAFCIVTASAEGLSRLEGPSSKWGAKITSTKDVEISDKLADLLAVVAFQQLGPEHEGINDPSQIIEVGNCLAGAGCPVVLEHMSSKDLRSTPLDKALNLAATLRTHTQLANASQRSEPATGQV